MSDKIAQKVTNHIKAHDRLIEIFGMEIEETRAGFAKVSMKVGHDHLNAAGLCHGAALFALADVTFALAVNCYGQMALAIEASINYFRPAKPGDCITAICKEVFQGKRTGTYLCSLTNAEHKDVAIFKATAFRIDQAPVMVQSRGQHDPK